MPGVGRAIPGDGEGCEGRLGAVYGLGADIEREPRLPIDDPPPARAQASVWKAQELNNNRAKTISAPLRQFLNSMLPPLDYLSLEILLIILTSKFLLTKIPK